MWCGRIKYCIIWPFVFQEATVTSYTKQCQDGSSSHFGNIVHHFLNGCFQYKWIRTGGLSASPPRSFDLITLDFPLWGHMKNIIYVEKNCRSYNSATWHEWWLQEWLKLSSWTFGEIEDHFGACWTINGAHAETY
jgi:hypothetical protein